MGALVEIETIYQFPEALVGFSDRFLDEP